MQSACTDDLRVLQVAFGTSAGRAPQSRRSRGRLLVGAGDVGGDAHRPAGATDQRRFDEIMAEDMPTKGRITGKVWKSCRVR